MTVEAAVANTECSPTDDDGVGGFELPDRPGAHR